MYGIVAFFDEKTEEAIMKIWSELKEREISYYASEVEDRRPHITLASHKNLDIANYIDAFDTWYDDKTTVEIAFKSIGSFFNSGTLFLSPIVTNKLMDLHTNHHKELQFFNDNPDSLYLPGSWIPHSTLANRLTESKLLEAFQYCFKRNTNVSGKITEIAIISTKNPT